jgi:hypothetical protein
VALAVASYRANKLRVWEQLLVVLGGIARRASRCSTICGVKRPLFNLLAGLSLVPCAMSVVLWVRGYRLVDCLYLNASNAAWGRTIESSRRVLLLCSSDNFGPLFHDSWETDRTEEGALIIEGYYRASHHFSGIGYLTFVEGSGAPRTTGLLLHNGLFYHRI